MPFLWDKLVPFLYAVTPVVCSKSLRCFSLHPFTAPPAMAAFPPTDGAMVPLDTARCLSVQCCQRVEAHHLAWKREGHGYAACPHRRRRPPGAWRHHRRQRPGSERPCEAARLSAGLPLVHAPETARRDDAVHACARRLLGPRPHPGRVCGWLHLCICRAARGGGGTRP